MVKSSAVKAAFGPVPEGIEVNRRVRNDSSVFVLINFKNAGQDVKLPRAMKSLFDKKEVTHVLLPEYGVAVLAGEKEH